jgi:hypothetical protein
MAKRRNQAEEQRCADYEARFLSLRAVRYDGRSDSLRLSLSSGVRLTIPRAQILPLAKANVEQLKALYAGNGGATISQDELDVDVFVPGLLDRLFGGAIRTHTASRAGRVSTPAKARAARKNGRKGGRPKRVPLKR